MSATVAPPRTMWRDSELEVVAERECVARGVTRIQKNRLLNVRRCGGVLRKRDASGGNGTASTVQIARDLYADVGAAWDAGDVELARELADNKRESIRRWLRVLADLGVIDYEPLTIGSGKWAGFRWRFLPVPDDVATMAASRGCSSVGYSVSSQQARRGPRTPSQDPSTRVRRWCPRAGRGAAYEPPPARPPFFSRGEFGATGARGGYGALKAPFPPSGNSGTDAYARPGPAAVGAVDGGDGGRGLVRDPVWAACPAEQRAALDRLRQTGTEGGGVALRRAGLDGAPWAALALAAWATFLPGVEPRCSHETAAQLDRSGRQLARLWGIPDAVDFLLGQIESLGPDGVDQLTGNRAGSIRVVAIVVRKAARREARRRRGAPPPRPHRPRGDGWL